MLSIDNITFEQAAEYLGNNVGAILVADQNADRYRSLVRRGFFQELLAEGGSYKELVQKLWFHFDHSNKQITEEYQVFIPNYGKFLGVYSKKLNLVVKDISHTVQMTIRPLADSGLYLFVLDELDEQDTENDRATQKQVATTIKNVYLFSMCIDLVKNTTSSMSLTEVSEDTMNSQISYTDWRELITGMIDEEYQDTFKKRSDPEYLRTHFKPGQMDSFDVQMRNLEGVFIWVKLIFSRMETTNENDYRFVYIVQNIHEATVNLRETLKQYELLASQDPLTKIFNHGRIETEINNAIDAARKNKTPLAMLMLDIDYFKHVNDQYGHAVGDTTLVRFTEIIRNTLKDSKAAYGRWGGEEFAVVLTGGQDAVQTAELLRTRTEQEEFPVAGKVTCSVGVTMFSPEDDFDSLFGRADQALYHAKESGRNRVCVR